MYTNETKNTTYNDFGLITNTLGIIVFTIHMDRINQGLCDIEYGVDGKSFNEELICAPRYSGINCTGILANRIVKPLAQTVYTVLDRNNSSQYSATTKYLYEHQFDIPNSDESNYDLKKLLHDCGFISAYEMLSCTHHRSIMFAPSKLIINGFGTAVEFMLKNALYEKLFGEPLKVDPVVLGMMYSKSLLTHVSQVSQIGLTESHLVTKEGDLNVEYYNKVTQNGSNPTPCIIHSGILPFLVEFLKEAIKISNVTAPAKLNLYSLMAEYYYNYMLESLIPMLKVIEDLDYMNIIDYYKRAFLTGETWAQPFSHDAKPILNKCPIINATK